MSTQITLTIPDDLYQRAQRVAQTHQRNVTQILAEFAILGEPAFADENPFDNVTLLVQEEAAFLAQHTLLQQQYAGEYVAILGQELVDHDPDLEALSQRLHKRFGNTPLWVAPVKENPVEEWVFRSPRLATAK